MLLGVPQAQKQGTVTLLILYACQRYSMAKHPMDGIYRSITATTWSALRIDKVPTRTRPKPTHCPWSAADCINIVGACISYIALDGSQFNRFNGLLFSLESHLSLHLLSWAVDQSRACITAVQYIKRLSRSSGTLLAVRSTSSVTNMRGDTFRLHRATWHDARAPPLLLLLGAHEMRCIDLMASAP